MYAEEIYEVLKKQLEEQNGDSSFKDKGDDAKLLDSFIKKNGGDSNLFKSMKKMAQKEMEQWDYAASLAKEVASKKKFYSSWNGAICKKNQNQ
jgi:hypothetical protein